MMVVTALLHAHHLGTHMGVVNIKTGHEAIIARAVCIGCEPHHFKIALGLNGLGDTAALCCYAVGMVLLFLHKDAL